MFSIGNRSMVFAFQTPTFTGSTVGKSIAHTK